MNGAPAKSTKPRSKAPHSLTQLVHGRQPTAMNQPSFKANDDETNAYETNDYEHQDLSIFLVVIHCGQ